MIIEFIVGFILGKLIAALLDTFIVLSSSFTSSEFWSEFMYRLYLMNFYHIALGVIVGLMIVVWHSEGIFE